MDLGAYKEMNEDLTKKIKEINDRSNKIIEENEEKNKSYKDIINMIEQK